MNNYTTRQPGTAKGPSRSEIIFISQLSPWQASLVPSQILTPSGGYLKAVPWMIMLMIDSEGIPCGVRTKDLGT